MVEFLPDRGVIAMSITAATVREMDALLGALALRAGQVV